MPRLLLATVFAATLAIATLVQAEGTPRDHAPPPFPTADAGSEGSTTTCAEVLPYQEDLFLAFNDHARFMQFWGDVPAADVRAMPDEELLEILDDGQAMIVELEALAPPEIYAPAHQGIIERFAFEIDYLHFLGIDSAVAPSINRVTEALRLIYDGEMAIAEACPDEVEEAGGYIFIDPAILEDAIQVRPGSRDLGRDASSLFAMR